MRLVINAVLFLSLGLMCNLKAQSILYSTSFGSGSLPSGWTSNNARWTAGTSNPSSGYTGASGSGNVVASNSSPSVSSLTLTYSNSLSTIGYTNIQVQWGARLTTNMRTIFLEYSIDGGASWTTPQSGSYGDGQNFTQVSANSTWALVGAATLDSETNGVSDLRLRFRFASNTTYGGTYSIDDFIITGTPLPAGVDYFNKSTGNANLENLSNWGTNSDGSGVSPTDFTSDNQRFIIVNGTSPTIGADWLVTGINSKVVVSTAGFTIPANFSYSGTIDVGNSSTLSIANTVIPNFGTIDPTSTVNYSAVGDQDITPFTYGNLEISGSGNKNIITDNLIVLGNLSINSGALSLFNNSLAYCELRGQISGSGTLIGGSNTTLSITGSGPFGNLKMDVSNNTINNLFINRPGQSINLTSALNVLNTLSLNSGTLNIGGNNLFLNITSVTGSGTLTSNSNGTVYYQRNGNQTIYNTNYGNIAFFGSGTKTFLSSSNIIGNLSIAGSTTINTNNFDINLGGDFLNSGSTFTPGTGTVTLNGSSDQAISGETTFNNLTINKPSGGNVNLSSGMQTIRGFLTIQTLSGANKLNTNGNLTLASDASSTASLIDNNSSASAGGSVNGNVTIQRYHNGGTAQTRIFGSPIASSNVFTIGQGTYNV
ncbi:MAG: hypothetical protein SFY32_09155, partial [Bacteroidota bacterium]|nr:hypothetical protein [Bacteroidota bacterium]